MSTSYATLAEYLEVAGDESLGNKSAEVITDKLAEATSVIERVTRRKFNVQADSSRSIDYSSFNVVGRTLNLPWDLCRITSVTNGDGVEYAATEYVTTPRLRSVSGNTVSQDVHDPDSWPWYQIVLKKNTATLWTYTSTPEEAIVIVGRWGFSIEPPAEIKSACIRLADWFYQQDNSLADRSDTAISPDGPILVISDLPNGVQRRLLRYIRV